MAGESHLPLDFPLGGVDRSSEYELQPSGTTPTGVNVSSIDPATRRERGASRAGTARWIDARPAGSASMIQDLAVVVTASGDALLGSQESDGGVSGVPPGFADPSGVPDPSTNNEAGGDPDDPAFRNPDDRKIPDGGSGVPVPRDEPEDAGGDGGGGGSSGWEFVQKKFGSFDDVSGTSRTDELAFDSPTTDNQLLVVAYCYSDGLTGGGGVAQAPSLSVSDSLGLTWTELDAATHDYADAFFRDPHLKVWWARNTAGGACTVSVTQTAGGSITEVVDSAMLLLEYSGLETTTPFEGQGRGSGSITGIETVDLSGGAVTQNGSDRLALVVGWASKTFYDTPTPADGFTLRAEEGADGVFDGILFAAESLSTPSGSTVEPAVEVPFTFNGVNGAWVAVGMTFRWGS